MEKLSHTDDSGKAKMVDIAGKPDQVRRAVAAGNIRLAPATIHLIRENNLKKGDVLTVAEIAGIQAAKKTSELIPLCHPLAITKVAIHTTITENGVDVKATASCTGKTGIEMEALTAVAVALLTIYDMCKAVDKAMVIESIRLLEKTKSG